ncbi:hypothetical protein QCA50_006220 [Cerrena zonata]|uniref:SH3 domain-containing protein n=1 Tax=Cerrena zonata TaxID=2478898 RepID=A0AAW0GF11_9APHY
MSDAAFLQHILSQTQANITFLASQGHISTTDATDMITRLATAHNKKATSPNHLAHSVQSLAIAPSASIPTPAVELPARRNIPVPPPRVQKAKALWAYNEDGSEPNDLSFSSGEIVEIVDETNADWWTGKCRGRQGLFPSNHVEKINTPGAVSAPAPAIPTAAPWVPAVGAPAAPPSYQTAPGGYQGYGQEKPAYRPFGAAYHGADQPPPAAGVNAVGLQHDDKEHEKKKSKYGKLGNTMATSAAGGVGFGAGAAIGSGIIGAIF